ncbi:MAG: hypothetical protein KUG65_07755, partial [Sphingomonadaceae bacterium]|nr:hypothetical protein [Sphingomonadaceae bacterium]
PPIGGLTAQWIIMALQLVLIGIVMVHDRKVLGHIHRATWWGAGVVVAIHELTDIAARHPGVAAMAKSLSAR